jgi:mannose-1-phosphate guanylyltransferase
MVKERISLSINKEILDRLDREVDHISVDSRSAAVEQILSKYLSEKKKCVILAGGKAVNLYDDGDYRPLFKGKKHTLIEDIIGKVKKAGYGDILIVGSKEVLSAIYKIVGEDSSGCAIEYVEEKQHLGTAKTLQIVKDKIKGTFLFLPCDHYFELDLKDMEDYHKKNQGMLTLAIYSGTKYAWNKSSIVELEGNKIKTYEENPKENKTFLTSLLIGIAEPEVFDQIPLAQITYSLQEDVFPELAKEGNLIGYIFSGRWKNVHDKKDVIF